LLMRSVSKLLLVLLLAATLSIPCSLGQLTPDAGAVNGNGYANQFFNLTWEFPKEWIVERKGESGDRETRLIRLLPGGLGENESVELDYAGVSPQYEENLSQRMEAQGWQPVEGHGYYSLGGGVPAQRYDYQSKESPVRYLTILAGPFHNCELSVHLSAASSERIRELVKAAFLGIKIRPDWPPGAEANLILPTSPGSPLVRVRVSQGVSHALLQNQVPPHYPDEARRTHIQGSVVMLAHIGMDGLMKDLYVEFGHPFLVPAAVEAVSQWRYRPYLLQGKPVELETQVTVNFKLQ
jgi:TonB family protein